jgi:hypothetical protein
MPNGTYGGVRGEAGDDLTYSIKFRNRSMSPLDFRLQRKPPDSLQKDENILFSKGGFKCRYMSMVKKQRQPMG